MKKFAWLIILTSFFPGLNSCDKDDSEIAENKNVELFIESLKTGAYASAKLPDFTYEDIPALLQYRNETLIITKFPRNPISSYSMSECKLGMFVLWTIESIRAVSIDSPNMIMNFPSQNPLLGMRNSEEFQLVMDQTSHDIAAKAYYNWWAKNKKKNFSRYNNIDPLKSTVYVWR